MANRVLFHGIRQKLMGSFIVMVALLIIVSVATTFEQQSSSAISVKLNQVNMNLSVIQELNYNVVKAGMMGSFAIMARSPQQQTDLYTQYTQQLSYVNSEYYALVAKTSKADLQRYFPTFFTLWSTYQSTAALAFELQQAGDIKGAQAAYLKTSFAPVIQSLRGFTNHERLQSMQLQSQLAANRVSVNTITWFVAGVAAVISTLLGWFLSRLLTQPIVQVSGMARKVAQGDLQVPELVTKAKDETADLTRSFNLMVKNLRGLLAGVSQTAQQMAASSQELSASSEGSARSTQEIVVATQALLQGTQKQRAHAQEDARTMQAMADSISRVAGTTASVSLSAATVKQSAEQGSVAIHQAVQQMQSIQASVVDTARQMTTLNEQSKRIGQITSVIKEISEQTNLLSLNAAIEAARAGQHGLGFAVVAEEVRALAEQSANSSQEIAALIGQVQACTAQTESAMAHVTREADSGASIFTGLGESFGEIMSTVKRVADQIEDVAVATEEMSIMMQNISSSIAEMADISEKSTAQVEEVTVAAQEQLVATKDIASASVSLSDMAQEWQEVLADFRL